MNDHTNAHIAWKYEGNGCFVLYDHALAVMQCYAYATDQAGRKIDTRFAALSDMKQEKGGLLLTFESRNGLCLTEKLSVDANGVGIAQCFLSDQSGNQVASNFLVPLAMGPKGKEPPYLWRNLQSKMLKVPYDNTMWLRYEAIAMQAGRYSSDFSVLFDEKTREGILIGALDFSVWKNGIVCPAGSARALEARCGVCSEETHETLPHGMVSGESVASSRFGVLYGPDFRTLLEKYGTILHAQRRPRTWAEGVPFGFNSYAGLGSRLNAENFRETGRFIRDSLMPNGFSNRHTTYINMDSVWSRIPEDTMLDIVEELHRSGQKAGIYDAPFAYFGKDMETERIPGVEGVHTFAEIMLRDGQGRLINKVDNAHPYDVTHPLWKQWTAWKAKQFIDWGFDYLKFDFLSHGGMEGVHADPAITTGRQAITQAYQYIDQLYSEENVGRPFFISLSIAPLFPCGYGNARRFSCDSFGCSEDIEYVLNAQTYSWWTNGLLYQFNDPDHIVLNRSFCMLRESTEGEARARYTTGVIGGSVMLISDDYTQPQARERAIALTGNREINRIAASGVAFRPVDSAGDSASHAYTAQIDGSQYLALFTWNEAPETVTVDCLRAGLPADASWLELWSGKVYTSENGSITWHASGTDAAVLKMI